MHRLHWNAMPRGFDLREALGVELPLIQAPMAGVQGSALAIAVSSVGGLGSLPCAMLDAAGIHQELTRIRAATDRPFNVNFFCHRQPPSDPERERRWLARLAPYYAELGIEAAVPSGGPARMPFGQDAVEVLEEFRPAVVSFHFGLPADDLLAPVRRCGARILSTATTVDEALWLEARGVDAIIAQGLEAGGHRGMFLSDDLATQAGTLALVPQIVQAVRLPVIAAGGIASPAGVAAAMALGAAGVQVGTAYLLCPEAATSPVHAAALRGDGARVTALTNVFTGRPARSIVNRLIRELGSIASDVPAFPLAAAAVLPMRTAAERAGSGDFSPLWAGQNASGCRAMPAADLTRELALGLGASR